MTVHCAKCFPVRMDVPVLPALLGWTRISSIAARSEGMACLKFSFSLTIYLLMYSLVALPDAVLVISDELFAQPTGLVVIMLFSQ